MYEKYPKRSVCLRGRKGWSVPKHSALIRSPTRIMFWLTEHLTQCRCVCAVTLCVFEHVVRIIFFLKTTVEVYPFKDTTQSGMTQLYTPFSSTRKTPRGNRSEANDFLNSEKTNRIVWKEAGYSTDHFYSTTNQIYLKNLNIFSDFILELSLFGLHCSKGY